MGQKKKAAGRADARARAICEVLFRLYPDAECALRWDGEPWKLLVLARLSAQCTDARVNQTGEVLFARFPTAESLAQASLEDIEEIVRPCGLFRLKAQNIRDEMQILTETYHGTLPSSMEELLAFPGVGRKIANLLRGDVFGLPAIVADTHCIRICGRLGFYPEANRDPLVTERVMTACVPPDVSARFCHCIVQFGRDFCTARAPKCTECPLRSLCPYPAP